MHTKDSKQEEVDKILGNKHKLWFDVLELFQYFDKIINYGFSFYLLPALNYYEAKGDINTQYFEYSKVWHSQNPTKSELEIDRTKIELDPKKNPMLEHIKKNSGLLFENTVRLSYFHENIDQLVVSFHTQYNEDTDKFGFVADTEFNSKASWRQQLDEFVSQVKHYQIAPAVDTNKRLWISGVNRENLVGRVVGVVPSEQKQDKDIHVQTEMKIIDELDSNEHLVSLAAVGSMSARQDLMEVDLFENGNDDDEIASETSEPASKKRKMNDGSSKISKK